MRVSACDSMEYEFYIHHLSLTRKIKCHLDLVQPCRCRGPAWRPVLLKWVGMFLTFSFANKDASEVSYHSFSLCNEAGVRAAEAVARNL